MRPVKAGVLSGVNDRLSRSFSPKTKLKEQNRKLRGGRMRLSTANGLTDPADIIAILTSLGVRFGRIGIEAGPLSQWLVNALTMANLPAAFRSFRTAYRAGQAALTPHSPTATTKTHCRMPAYGPRSAHSPGQRLSALVWKIPLLHGAQTRLVQNAAIAGDAPRTLSRLGTERIQGQCAALLKITQEIPVRLQACHGGQRGKPGRAVPASCCACKEGYGDRWAGMRGTTGPGMSRIAS